MSLLKDTRCRKCGTPFSKPRFWSVSENEYLLDGMKCKICDEDDKSYEVGQQKGSS